VGSGNSISGTSILLFSEDGFMIILLLIVFVFDELEVVSLLYFNSNVGNIVILLCNKNKFSLFF
jgi:hypothetical protein